MRKRDVESVFTFHSNCNTLGAVTLEERRQQIPQTVINSVCIYVPLIYRVVTVFLRWAILITKAALVKEVALF